jgi:curved DNA-binding protein CbpA
MSETTDISALSALESEELGRLVRQAEDGNYYKLLGIDPQADTKEIQAAFFAHSRTWHPDRFFRRELGDDGERLEMLFVTLTQAYKTLSDPAKRRSHDRKLEEIAQKAAAAAAAAKPRRSLGSDSRSSNSERSVTQPQTLGDPPGERSRRSLRPSRNYQPAPNNWERISSSRGGLERLRAAAAEQLVRAKAHYDQAIVERANGNILRANVAVLLASELDPSNAEYRRLAGEMQLLTRKQMAVQAATQARSAESFHSMKEAITQYKRAADEYQTDDPTVYHRLGLLLLKYEEDERGALAYLRQATHLSPDNPDFHASLGALFASLGMERNARREYQAALKINKNHEASKEGLKGLKG